MSQVPEPAAFQVFQVPFTVADQTSIVRAMEQAESQLREADGNIRAILDRDLSAIEGLVVFLDDQASGSTAKPILDAERLVSRMDQKTEAQLFDQFAQTQVESASLGVDAFGDEPAPATRTYSETDINPDTAPTGWYNACTGADLSLQHYFNSDTRQWFDLRQRPISIEQMRSGRIYGGPYRDAITAAGDLGRLRSLGFVFCPAPPVVAPTAPTAPSPAPTAPQPPPPAPPPAPLPGEEPKPEPAPAPGFPPPPQPVPVPSPAPAPLPGMQGYYLFCTQDRFIVRYLRNDGLWFYLFPDGSVGGFDGTVISSPDAGPFVSFAEASAFGAANWAELCPGGRPLPPPPAPPGVCPPCPMPEPPPEEEEEPPQAGCSPCWPCPTDMVEEKGKYVSIVPWGVHQGPAAWIESECGRREFSETAAEYLPASIVLNRLQSSGGVSSLDEYIRGRQPPVSREELEGDLPWLDLRSLLEDPPSSGGGFQLPFPQGE